MAIAQINIIQTVKHPGKTNEKYNRIAKYLPNDWKVLLVKYYEDDPAQGLEDWLEVMIDHLIEEYDATPTKIMVSTLRSLGARRLDDDIERGLL